MGCPGIGTLLEGQGQDDQEAVCNKNTYFDKGMRHSYSFNKDSRRGFGSLTNKLRRRRHLTLFYPGNY